MYVTCDKEVVDNGIRQCTSSELCKYKELDLNGINICTIIYADYKIVTGTIMLTDDMNIIE